MREEEKPGTAGLGLECNLLPNNYMLFVSWDHTLEFVPQEESTPSVSQSPLPIFSITICNGDCVGSKHKSTKVCVCVFVRMCETVSQKESLQATEEHLLDAQSLLVLGREKDRSLSSFGSRFKKSLPHSKACAKPGSL